MRQKKWIVTPAIVQDVQALVEQQKNTPFVQQRVRRNLAEDKPKVEKSDFWKQRHWKTTTFVGGLTKSGIVAPMLLDGPINGDSFKAYVEQVLAPVFRPDDLVVLDNLSSHKTAMVRKTLEDNGIRTKCQPPYSPDLNPIENAFSKFEVMVRSAALRQKPDPCYSINRLIHKYQPAECANDFWLCGYGNADV